MKRILITAINLALILIFGALIKTWAGFEYFALVFTCLLTGFWVVVLIIDYIKQFHRVDEKDFKLYVAYLVNFKNVTLEDVEANKPFYIKKYKKSLWKDKCIELAKIIFTLGIFIACAVLMFALH